MITCGGDFVAQTVFERQKTVDYKRIGTFVLYTLLITPLYSRWYQFPLFISRAIIQPKRP